MAIIKRKWNREDHQRLSEQIGNTTVLILDHLHKITRNKTASKESQITSEKFENQIIQLNGKMIVDLKQKYLDYLSQLSEPSLDYAPHWEKDKQDTWEMISLQGKLLQSFSDQKSEEQLLELKQKITDNIDKIREFLEEIDDHVSMMENGKLEEEEDE
jgi:hypothetical protein